jgi:hypothetical protein
MGINLELDGPDGIHGTDLCTNGGYTALCEWIETLPEEDFPAVRSLAENGEYTPTDELMEQLERAIAYHPPADKDTLDVANTLADRIGAGYPGETVRIEY